MSDFNSIWSPALIGLVVAFGVGLLVGVDRERNKGSGATRGAAGVRTFVLISLLGAIAALLGNAALTTALALGVVALATVSHWRTRNDDAGLTTEAALLVTFALGVLALAHPKLAAALGVTVALLLASRSWLHQFIRQGLSDREMLDGLLLAAAALIVLPVLPDRAIDPFDVVNPHLIWRITVMVLLINAAGYVAMRSFKNSHGLALAGFFGGFVSSTATIASMGAYAHSTPSLLRAAAAGAALSSVATALQLTLVLYLANPMLATALLPALSAFAMVAVAYGLLLSRYVHQVQGDQDLPGRAFELKRAFGFALLVTVVMFISAVLAHRYGAAGASIGIALAGFADTHSAAASAAGLAANGTLADHTAVFAILLAVSANTLSKAGVALLLGGRMFGALVLPGLVLMLIALWTAVALTIGW